MKLFLDSAITEEIEFAIEYYGIDGITTNPRHVQVSGKPFLGVIREIGEIVRGTDLTVSVEVNPHFTEFDEIVREAEKLAALSPNFVIKLQTMEGSLKALPYLKKKGIRVNYTLVFSSVQALFAMRGGAFYVSPFIGWKETNGEAVQEYVRECVAIRDNFNFDTEIIVAAVRNGRQIADAAVAGADIVTAGLQVYRDALDHPYTRDGIRKFTSFWDQTQYE